MRNRHLKTRGLALVLAAGLFTVPALALATPMYYAATLMPGNDSGVMGSANFTLDGDTLMVHIKASGLVPNENHPQHIHEMAANGKPDMNPAFGLMTAAAEPSGDPAAPSNYPFVGSSGILNFSGTYDLAKDPFFGNFDETNLLPLTNDWIMLHGIDNAAGHYEPGMMAAMGRIHAVPEPSSLFDMLAGLGAMLLLVGFGRRRMARGKAR